jgi:hypothetical protein
LIFLIGWLSCCGVDNLLTFYPRLFVCSFLKLATLYSFYGCRKLRFLHIRIHKIWVPFYMNVYQTSSETDHKPNIPTEKISLNVV